MKIVFEYIGLVFLLLILSISIWNAFSLRSIKMKLKRKDKLSNEYFDIKYKLQLITTIGSIIVAIIIFYGYNSENIIQESINKTVSTKIDEKEIEISKRFNDTLNSYLTRIALTEDKIKRIESKEIINADIYIVKDQKIFSKDFKRTNLKIYFSKLRTITGKELPKFAVPPVINIIPTNGMEYVMLNKTTEYFELKLLASTYENSTFDIWFAK